jgi:hypothetical protein
MNNVPCAVYRGTPDWTEAIGHPAVGTYRQGARLFLLKGSSGNAIMA